MNKHDAQLLDDTYNFQQLFEPSANTNFTQTVHSNHFERINWSLSEQSNFILDKFPDTPGATCCFGRFLPGNARKVQLIVSGGHELVSCSSGGWLLKALDSSTASYWIPQLPVLRKIESLGRILSEEEAPIVEFKTTANDFSIVISIPEETYLDMTIWCFTSDYSNIVAELEQPLVIERQPVFFWTSETTYQSPADLYLYLLHGHVYTKRYIWPRNWKMCSELDAYGLYVTFNGLETSTGKVLYNLFKRQVLFSVIARQADDGAWYHGEWTKYLESHYRFHNGAMLILESALKERSDEVVSHSLQRAAQFISQKTDDTELGLWFLHDSLEDSIEMMEEMCRVNKSNWIRLPILGKSATNKLIFNTHVDTLIALDHYRDVTGDEQYVEKVDSARKAALGMLALRPAEALYSLFYRAIKLTLLPKAEAEKLPVLVRAFKRLTWMYIAPNLYRIKNIYPRLVMPGGYIERQLGMGHFDVNYHPINVMDLARLWRCFPDDSLAQTIDEAVAAVTTSNNMLDYWAEKASRHKSLVEWVDALYHLCMLKQNPDYRQFLAEGMIKIEDTGVGLPPALIGGDPEAIAMSERVPSPSPTEVQLRIANLSSAGHREILVVNAAHDSLEFIPERSIEHEISWVNSEGQAIDGNRPLLIAPRSWVWGKKDL